MHGPYLSEQLSLPVRNFRSLSSVDQQLLSRILCHQPPPSTSQTTSPSSSTWWQNYVAQTKKEIMELPTRLRAYPSILARFANARAKAGVREKSRMLCPLHEKMNRAVVRDTLAWVQKEIDLNVPAIVEPLQRDGLLRHDVVQAFTTLRDCSGMWLDPAVFEVFFARKVKTKWRIQGDRCAACVLARLGSDRVAVVALKAGFLARLGLRGKRSSVVGGRSCGGSGGRRLHYIECMIDQFDGADTMHRDAERFAGLLEQALEKRAREQRKTRDIVIEAGKSARDSRVGTMSHRSLRKPGRMAGSCPRSPETTASVMFEVQTPGSRTMRRDDADEIYVRFKTPTWEPYSGKQMTQPDDGQHSDSPNPLEISSAYEPIPWRMAKLDRKRPSVDVDSIISDYRKTVFEPSFGVEDFLGLKGEALEGTQDFDDSSYDSSPVLSFKVDNALDTLIQDAISISPSLSSLTEDISVKDPTSPTSDLQKYSAREYQRDIGSITPFSPQPWKPTLVGKFPYSHFERAISPAGLHPAPGVQAESLSTLSPAIYQRPDQHGIDGQSGWYSPFPR